MGTTRTLDTARKWHHAVLRTGRGLEEGACRQRYVHGRFGLVALVLEMTCWCNIPVHETGRSVSSHGRMQQLQYERSTAWLQVDARSTNEARLGLALQGAPSSGLLIDECLRACSSASPMCPLADLSVHEDPPKDGGIEGEFSSIQSKA